MVHYDINHQIKDQTKANNTLVLVIFNRLRIKSLSGLWIWYLCNNSKSVSHGLSFR